MAWLSTACKQVICVMPQSQVARHCSQTASCQQRQAASVRIAAAQAAVPLSP